MDIADPFWIGVLVAGMLRMPSPEVLYRDAFQILVAGAVDQISKDGQGG